jgi:phosphonate transport system substrate-binding protein
MRRLLALFLLMSLIAAACASDDGDTTADVDESVATEAEETDADEATEEAAEEMADGDVPADWPESIVLGLVPSQEVDELVETAQPLADLLAAELGIEVESFVPQSYTALVEAMNTGQAQIGAFGPIALVQAADRAGAIPVLQSVRFGSATYHTQWMTNDPDRFCEDEPVADEDGFLFCNGTDTAEEGPVGEESLANIEEGETIFFVDAASASGYYYPATQLQELGLDPFTDIDAQFAGGHPNAVQAVARGDAAIATSFDDARTGVVEENPEVGEQAVVFAWSTEIPNDGIAVSGDIPESLQDAITQAFLDIASTDEGLEALFDIYEIEDLVPVDLDALDAARQVEANFGDE